MPTSAEVSLPEALRKYLSPSLPFGPADSTLIEEPECAERLYEWQNVAFAELLRGSHVIVGRRGSGKSALIKIIRNTEYARARLSSARGREYGKSLGISLQRLDFRSPLVVEVRLETHEWEMRQQFAKTGAIPAVELVAEQWKYRIFFLIGDAIREHLPELWDKLPVAAHRYITGADLTEIDPNDRASILSASKFTDLIHQFLVESGQRVVLTFDSMEDYRFTEEENVIIAGLFRIAGRLIALQRSPVDVKLCIPAETYDFIKPSILNPDKDTTKKQFLHWSARELMHLTAHRLKAYFELYEPKEFTEVRTMNLSDEKQLRKFWARYLPREIVNRMGVREDTVRYILRHTHMLPRHMITILNSIFETVCREDGRRPVTQADVLEGIRRNEETFCDTILKMFRIQYPAVDVVFRKVLPRLARIFTFGELEKIWREEARRLMAAMGKDEFWQFTRLMLATGAVGLVDRDASTSIYIEGVFEFNTRYELKISDKDLLCIHPLFSGHYNLADTKDNRMVLPRGSDLGFETTMT